MSILLLFLGLVIVGCAALAIGMDLASSFDLNDVFDEEDEEAMQ